MEIKVIKINSGIYQIEAGFKAIVLKAKNEAEAIKKACRYLGIRCNEIVSKRG
ncbi:hypothetical protein [Caminibacter mediatlanticus]|uniref:hypothetical protein n=1 Tax=Caminibacter mediatlanticus TaxID=291048 RepID=UPI0015868539|nr:hypothetical protein [Caminibacter mediatlanticus]